MTNQQNGRSPDSAHHSKNLSSDEMLKASEKNLKQTSESINKNREFIEKAKLFAASFKNNEIANNKLINNFYNRLYMPGDDSNL